MKKQLLNEVIKAIIIEAISSITAYHTATERISSFRPMSGMWFTPYEDAARAYHGNAITDGAKEQFTFVVKISGKILTREELENVCEELGIDLYDYEAFLTSNPRDPSNNEDTKKIVALTGCDGFIHSDYDPRNFSRDVDSIFVIDPSRCVKLVGELDVNNKHA